MSNPNEKQYLCFFGYETPTQFRNNELFGWDDEDCQIIRVMATSEEAALEWTAEVAEQFLKKLFNDDEISWKHLRYAHGVESQGRFVSAAVSRSPLVSFGEMPDLDWMVKDALRQSL